MTGTNVNEVANEGESNPKILEQPFVLLDGTNASKAGQVDPRKIIEP